MDLSKLSEQDLEALAAGDMSRMSDAALEMVAQAQEGPQPAAEAPKARQPKAPVIGAAERFLQGLRDPFDAAEQIAVRGNRWLVGKGVPGARPLPADAGREVAERQRRFAAGKPEGVDWARMAGNIVSPPNLALTAVPGGGVVKAAAIGAGTGVLSPVAEEEEDFLAQKGTQAAVGAAAGGAGNVALRALSRVVSPNAARNPDLARLRAEGVRPTIGQALGGNASRWEEKLTSLPIVGDAIGAARGRARADFNRAAINRAAGAVGARVDDVGHEGVRHADDAIGAVYDQARTLGPMRLDRQGIRDLRTVVRNAQSRLPQREQDALRDILNRAGTDISPTGRIADFKALDSFLGKEAADFSSTGDAFQRRLGGLIRDAQTAMRSSAMRSNPQAGVMNTMADEGYRNLRIVKDAVTAAGRTDGNFAPGHLLSAVKKADRTVGKRATARGEAAMQDLAQSAQNVLGDRVPDSGTAGRLALGVGGLGAGFLDPSIPVSLVAGAAAYTPPVQRALVAMVANRSPGWQRAAEVLRAASAHAAAPAAVGSGSFFDDDYLEY